MPSANCELYYTRPIKPDATPKQALSASRVIVILMGVICLLLTFYPGGPTYLFAFSNAWMGPPAILLLLGMCWRRVTDKGALWGVVSGMAVMSVFTVLDLTGIYSIGVVMHVGVAGLFVTLAVTVAVSLATEPRYFGKRDWRRDPEGGAREDIPLQQADLAVLALIHSGLDQMVELADFMASDVSLTNECVERLDRGGYLMRASLCGAGFYSFTLTEKGVRTLPVKTGKEAALEQEKLTPQALALLSAIGRERVGGFAKETGMPGGAVSAWISVMERRGYVRQLGFMRRRVALTPAGTQLLNNYKEDFKL